MISKIVICVLLCIPILSGCTYKDYNHRNDREGMKEWTSPPLHKVEPLVTPYAGTISSIDCPKDSQDFHSNHHKKYHKKYYKSNNKIVALSPKYLQVKDFKECLGTEPVSSSHTQYCIPGHKPEHCPFDSWQQLVKLDIPRCKS